MIVEMELTAEPGNILRLLVLPYLFPLKLSMANWIVVCSVLPRSLFCAYC